MAEGIRHIKRPIEFVRFEGIITSPVNRTADFLSARSHGCDRSFRVRLMTDDEPKRSHEGFWAEQHDLDRISCVRPPDIAFLSRVSATRGD